MQLPETIADNWLVGLLVSAWAVIITVGSSKNKEQLWLFGKVYARWRDRRVTAIEQKTRVESAVIEALRRQVAYLSERVEAQEKDRADLEKRYDHELANQANEIREIRSDNLEHMRYSVSVRRWAIEGMADMGGDPSAIPDFPTFREWRKQRGRGTSSGDDIV